MPRLVLGASLPEDEPLGGESGFCSGFAAARNQEGRASASTFSSESTRAERLSDVRKARREGNKRSLSTGPVLEFAPISLYSGNLEFASSGHSAAAS